MDIFVVSVDITHPTDRSNEVFAFDSYDKAHNKLMEVLELWSKEFDLDISDGEIKWNDNTHKAVHRTWTNEEKFYIEKKETPDKENLFIYIEKVPLQ